MKKLWQILHTLCCHCFTASTFVKHFRPINGKLRLQQLTFIRHSCLCMMCLIVESCTCINLQSLYLTGLKLKHVSFSTSWSLFLTYKTYKSDTYKLKEITLLWLYIPLTHLSINIGANQTIKQTQILMMLLGGSKQISRCVCMTQSMMFARSSVFNNMYRCTRPTTNSRVKSNRKPQWSGREPKATDMIMIEASGFLHCDGMLTPQPLPTQIYPHTNFHTCLSKCVQQRQHIQACELLKTTVLLNPADVE